MFSQELMYNISVAISHEVRAFYNEDIRHGVYGKSGLSCLSPVINIMRHPLWGRNQVYQRKFFAAINLDKNDVILFLNNTYHYSVLNYRIFVILAL